MCINILTEEDDASLPEFRLQKDEQDVWSEAQLN